MRALAPACLLLILLSSAGPSQANFIDDIISLFTHHEDAPYSVIRRGNGYEMREYPARKWVCNKKDNNPNLGDDLSQLFWPLFKYISGENMNSEVIQMTVPVTTEFTINSPNDKIFDMCFYLGQEHQDNPPSPQPSSGLYIQERERMRIYTRTVGGYVIDEKEWMQEAAQLLAILQEDGISGDLSHMFWAGYDAPLKFWNRRNEVWFLAN